jgi:hypothetical protein
MQTRYEPTTINDLQKCLDGCGDKMRVEVKGGVSLDVKTVADLRSLLVWPSGLAVVVPDEVRELIARRRRAAAREKFYQEHPEMRR